MTHGKRSGLPTRRRAELYRAALHALRHVTHHPPPMPTIRGFPRGWTRHGVAVARMEALSTVAVLRRLDLDNASARILDATERIDTERRRLDDTARTYAEVSMRLQEQALADMATAEVTTGPLRMRRPREAS